MALAHTLNDRGAILQATPRALGRSKLGLPYKATDHCVKRGDTGRLLRACVCRCTQQQTSAEEQALQHG
jgi:hypothetical protein